MLSSEYSISKSWVDVNRKILLVISRG